MIAGMADCYELSGLQPYVWLSLYLANYRGTDAMQDSVITAKGKLRRRQRAPRQPSWTVNNNSQAWRPYGELARKQLHVHIKFSGRGGGAGRERKEGKRSS